MVAMQFLGELNKKTKFHNYEIMIFGVIKNEDK